MIQYSGENRQLESAVDAQILALRNLIESKYISTSAKYCPVDLPRLVNYMTTDLIGAVSYGRPFGFISNDEDMFEYLARTEKILPAVGFVATFPVISKVISLPILRRCLMPSPNDKTWLGKFLGLARPFVAKQYQTDHSGSSDMVESFKRHGLTADESAHDLLFRV